MGVLGELLAVPSAALLLPLPSPPRPSARDALWMGVLGVLLAVPSAALLLPLPSPLRRSAPMKLWRGGDCDRPCELRLCSDGESDDWGLRVGGFASGPLPFSGGSRKSRHVMSSRSLR